MQPDPTTFAALTRVLARFARVIASSMVVFAPWP